MGGVEFVVPFSRKKIFSQKIKKHFNAYVGEGGLLQDLNLGYLPSIKGAAIWALIKISVLNANKRKKPHKYDYLKLQLFYLY